MNVGACSLGKETKVGHECARSPTGRADELRRRSGPRF